jgi:hypothetical protein
MKVKKKKLNVFILLDTLISVAQGNLRGILAYGWYLDHLNQTWQDFYGKFSFFSFAYIFS